MEQGKRLAGRPFVLDCISDQHAISVAEMLTLSGRDVEVWQGERVLSAASKAEFGPQARLFVQTRIPFPERAGRPE